MGLRSTLQLIGDAIRGGEDQDFTRMGVRRAIVLLSIPMVLEMGMESVFALVDAFYVSRLGVDAIATVGLTESVMMIIYSLAWGLGMGVTAVVAATGPAGAPEPVIAAGLASPGVVLATESCGAPGCACACSSAASRVSSRLSVLACSSDRAVSACNWPSIASSRARISVTAVVEGGLTLPDAELADGLPDVICGSKKRASPPGKTLRWIARTSASILRNRLSAALSCA